MSTSNRWPRDLVCLLAGALLMSGVLHFRRPVARRQWAVSGAPSPSQPAPSGPRAAFPGEDAPDASQILRQARTEAAHAWQAVLTAYRSPESDHARAVSLMLQLDVAGLSRLAASLADEKDANRFLGAVGDVFNRWSELDPAAALALAKTLLPPYRARALDAALDGFVRTQPAAACAYLTGADGQGTSGLGTFGAQSFKLAEAFKQWSEQDPAAAARFYDQVPTLVSDYAARDIAGAWVKQDPAAAMQWATRLPDKPRQWAMQGGLQAWAQTDPTAALQFYNGLADPAEQRRLTSFLAGGWSSTDPQAAAQWIVGLESSSRNTQQVYAALDPWVQSDPAAATAWASGLASESARNLAWPVIAKGLAANDTHSAEQWLGTLPAGESRDDAIYAYCYQAGVGNNPTTRLDWVGRIGSATRRDTVTAKILTDWLASQPQAAQQWISQANLPASVLTQIGKATGP